ncbi:hypothetical protein [Blastococcus sp. TF02A-26]|uniref:hypothetical protein n=1 Tax=Blastococcus sp. TF02A-26 TaxID=2250577 RepID=UPI000DEBE17D|nr:hypothetical protein [Blastococcus sp. TF02A-26]RBY88820.1 hypothetical protein DQ240_04500 [Blastococcus sp. TF02A-26]
MSGPQDRDRDGFDDRDGSGWREPEHLGEGSSRGDSTPGGTPPADPPQEPQRPAADPGWQPPGWDLPAAEPARPRDPGYEPWPDRPGPQAPPQQPPARGGGLFGPRRPRQPGEVEKVFAYQGDPVGAQGWAVQNGWEISDGTGPEDAALGLLLTTAPTRLTRDHRPAGVMRGRYGTLDLVAFDVVYADTRRMVPEYAITAAPVLATLPALRLSPVRFWKHRTGGLAPVPSGDPQFDDRWVLLSSEDSPVVRRLVEDPTVRGLLLDSDDGDEFWSAGAGGLSGGYVAAIRPDGQRPELIEHHARLLAAVVGALAAAQA